MAHSNPTSHAPRRTPQETTPPAAPTVPAVLLINLGSPERPEPASVRRFLRPFLADRRVIELHPLLWRPLLEGIILRVRPRKVAAKYASIWHESGLSPLTHYAQAQARHLQKALGTQAKVFLAMRYGQDSIPRALKALHARGHRHVLVLPLYPQYTASTVGTIYDEVARHALTSRDQTHLRLVRSFPAHHAYINALAHALETHWEHAGRPDFAAGDKLICSFHSIPEAMVRKGDPYPHECEATAQALASALHLPTDALLVTYQSVFGPAKWIGPATIDTIAALPAQGTRRVDVICPGFTADCLETLEEINLLNREAWEQGGAKSEHFHYVPWANDETPWLDALAEITREELAGWID